MLQEKDKQLLRGLIRTPTWEVMLRVFDELTKETESKPLVGETNDETLKNVYMREGRKNAIKDFLQKLIESAND